MAGAVSSQYYFLHVMIIVPFFLSLFLCNLSDVRGGGKSAKYREALKKAVVFFEGQRSGKLPGSTEEGGINWRRDSAVNDGQQINKDLSGGYYDAGDNEKFNFPMAFTTTMLSWSVIEFGGNMGDDQLESTRVAIKWATDYLLKCASDVDTDGVLYVGVGDGSPDHDCWERPEDIDGDTHGGAQWRSVYSVNRSSPGSEVAAETAAALAAASIVFRKVDSAYSRNLLTTAKAVMDFAIMNLGSYSNKFYPSYSGYHDELIWGEAWLLKATNNANKYMNSIKSSEDYQVPKMASWDNKYAAASVLLSKRFLSKKMKNSDQSAQVYSTKAETFMCAMLNPSLTKGGLMYLNLGGSNLQYVTAITFLMVTYAKYMADSNHIFTCSEGEVKSTTLKRLAKTQVDYILGKNPRNMSYMVGYGSNFPKYIHHRASSIPSVKNHPVPIGCAAGQQFLSSPLDNPNVLIGAIVGGPDQSDQYADDRNNYAQSEPTTYINAPLVGTLACLAGKLK